MEPSAPARAGEGFAVTVDLVLLTIVEADLCVLAVRRGEEPYRGRWALPGGFVRPEENLEEAARRVFEAKTGLSLPHVEQLGSYGEVDRDPRMRVVTVAWLVFLPIGEVPGAEAEAASGRFFPLPMEGTHLGLAFDHDRIVADAAERCRSKLEYTTLGATFLPAEFTLGDLRRVYEAVWGEVLHPGNFVRKVRSIPGFVVATGRRRRAAGAPEVFRAGPAAVMMPPLMRRGYQEGGTG